MAKPSKLVTGLVVGAAVGVIAGLLLAPKPGKETRRVVASRAGELRQKAAQYASTLRRKKGANGSGAMHESSEQQVGTLG